MSDMTRLSIFKIAGPYCATYKQGEQLFYQIARHFKAGEKVELDFENVELASSSFFNELFGRISEEFGDEFRESHLLYFGLKPRHKFVLERTQHISHA